MPNSLEVPVWPCRPPWVAPCRPRRSPRTAASAGTPVDGGAASLPSHGCVSAVPVTSSAIDRRCRGASQFLDIDEAAFVEAVPWPAWGQAPSVNLQAEARAAWPEADPVEVDNARHAP